MQARTQSIVCDLSGTLRGWARAVFLLGDLRIWRSYSSSNLNRLVFGRIRKVQYVFTIAGKIRGFLYLFDDPYRSLSLFFLRRVRPFRHISSSLLRRRLCGRLEFYIFVFIFRRKERKSIITHEETSLVNLLRESHARIVFVHHLQILLRFYFIQFIIQSLSATSYCLSHPKSRLIAWKSRTILFSIIFVRSTNCTGISSRITVSGIIVKTFGI